MTKFEFQPFDKVLVRDGENQTWRADFYSHEDDTSWPFCCMAGSDWKFCIPYNETTQHLCGTSDPYIDPAEAPAFEFGDVVKVSFPGEPSYKGIFSRANNETGEARCNILLKMGDKTWYNMEIPLSYVTLVRKGNFND